MAAPLFERIVLTLVDAAGPTALVTQVSTAGCAISAGAVDALVLRGDAVTDEALLALLKERRPRRLELVLVGGDAARTAALKRARPAFTPAGLGLAHVRDDGTVWMQGAQHLPRWLGANGAALAQRLVQVEVSDAALEALAARAVRDRAAAEAMQQELQGWAEQIHARRPIATWSLAGLIGVAFALQLVVGLELPPQLLRMGALSPERVADGEVWRLLSCSLLHGGVMHVAFNTYVLVALGMFLERVIGAPRLLVLYVLSALAGSVGSALFLGERFSVGASGAVWGLLGAHAVLAFRSGGLVPDAILPGARRAAMINLGLNVANSFQPHVDMAAHFAGGLAGAALFLLLRCGLPAASSSPRPIAAPASLRAGSALLVVALVGSFAVALAQGDPLSLDRAPTLERVHVAERGVSLELPSGLERNARLSNEGETLFGAPLHDPLFVGVLTFELRVSGPEELELELADLLEGLREPPEGVPGIGAATPERFDDHGDPGVRISHAAPNGLTFERAFLFRSGQLVRIEVYRWPGLAAAPPGIAERIARSVRVR